MILHTWIKVAKETSYAIFVAFPLDMIFSQSLSRHPELPGYATGKIGIINIF